MDDESNPLEERPFTHELGEPIRHAVEQVRSSLPPVASQSRALERARRLGPPRVNPWLTYQRVAVAASIAAVAVLSGSLLVIAWHFQTGSNPQGDAVNTKVPDDAVRPDSKGIDVSVDAAELGVGFPAGVRKVAGPKRAAAGGQLVENPCLAADRHPISTFPLSGDAVSYADVRRSLLDAKRLPPADAVRVAELVNAFSYSYPQPDKGDPVSVTLDLAECPWNPAHHLVRIGLQARRAAGPEMPAKEVDLQVAFNPRLVGEYRLIGHESLVVSEADASDDRPHGDAIVAGQAVTALYEIAPADRPPDPAECGEADAGNWLAVTMRYKSPEAETEKALSQSLTGPAAKLADAPADFRLAAAAAAFGQLLRDSEYKGDATYAAVRALATAAPGSDPDGRRAEFLTLVAAAEKLTAGRKVALKDPVGIP